MNHTSQITTPFLISTNLRVWGSKNATATNLLVANQLQIPLWKPTELQINLADNHNIDRVLFEIDDQSAFFSKLSISPEMSKAILNCSNLTAGQLKRAAPVSSPLISFSSSVKGNTASAVLIPDFKDKEISSKSRFLTVSLLRGTSTVGSFKIEYRVYSKHSGTRSALLLNPAPGTGASRAAAKLKQTEKVAKKPSFKAARTTTKKTTTPLSVVDNCVRTKIVKAATTPSSDQENLEMPLSRSEVEYFPFACEYYTTSITLPGSPLSHDEVLSVAAAVVNCDESYSASPSSETDTESCSESSSSCADEEFAKNVMDTNIDFAIDVFDSHPLQDSTPFLAQISV
eukprot:TRINITY_DN2037_c0_g1_i2.p1 TRINITY_DN2037_c0_g1~~TRINITY_DN2037_c0_g1_i2.p1  ORF type:complete len:366 (+),score=175.35 TRINITY_DN2037_c0_g1_i2:70-1098(+)